MEWEGKVGQSGLRRKTRIGKKKNEHDADVAVRLSHRHPWTRLEQKTDLTDLSRVL